MKRVVCVVLAILICGTAIWAQQSNGVAFADKPAILTSVGQSADIEMVRVLLTRAGIPFQTSPLVMASELNNNDKTMILVIGGSSKGLGAAGISADDEMRRTEALVTRARQLNMNIIAIHVGGDARRGDLSDDFIRYAVPLADYAIVVSDGNRDNLFTTLTNQARIPLNTAERISGVGTPLAAAFR